MRHPIVEEDLRAIAAAALPWDRLKGKEILVSGAAGFLPAYMVETILYLNETRDLNARVTGLVRDLEKAEKRFAGYAGRKDLRLAAQDLGAPLSAAVEADIVLHAASQASPKFYGTDPVGTLLPNVVGTAGLLEGARKWGSSHFLFFSSGEVYGEVAPERMPIEEGGYGVVDPAALRSCYAESKRMGETMCVAWHHQYGVPAKVVRPFHTYGPGMRLDDGRVYADFVADVVHHRDIVLKSRGEALRAFCYLADAVLGFFTVLLLGKNGEAYNIGNAKAEVSIADLAHRLVSLSPKKGLRVVHQERPQGGYLQSAISRSCPSTAKAQGLGWNPTTGIEEGFSRTIRSYM